MWFRQQNLLNTYLIDQMLALQVSQMRPLFIGGGCKAGVIFSAEPKTPPEVLAVLPADSEFSSGDKALRAVRPSVTEILIGY
jgi:hypothetical protein